MSKKEPAESFGTKLKKLREKEGLSLEELGERTDLKPLYLRSLEVDEFLPHVAEIIKLARTLSVEPSSFMEKDLPASQPARRKKEQEVRTRDYAYKTLTPFEAGRHLMAFRVTIDPESTHKKVVYRHEGEEFIYVVSGRLQLQVGKKHHRLAPGETVRFDSSEKHILKNPGKEPTDLLVVVYAP